MDIGNKLRNAMKGKQYEPFIEHIRFPFFKNLAEGARADFSYPVTALVGQNGTNKSSVLRALYGSPNGYSIGALWFSTSVDEIRDDGRSRFIYGYHDKFTDKTVEVIKTRINKPDNPDYWEPSRPIVADGMEKMLSSEISPNKNKTRWKAIEKNVIYIDFRATISAFDKAFYHSDLETNNRQDFLRKRSLLLKNVIENEYKSYRPFKGKKEKVHENIILTQDELNVISKVLGREYKKITLINHGLFTSITAPTAILESSTLNYSEAFAGSGEFAVVMLVHKVMSARPNSLILLDEPEVSLHPAAQEKLMDFLFKSSLDYKHQIVISTHSPSIIKKLPDDAIKLFLLNENTSKVDIHQKIIPAEAFFYIGEKIAKKTIFVEDILAKRIVMKSLEKNKAMLNSFDIKYIPGGASTLIQNIAVSHFLSKTADSIFLLDGDQEHSIDIPDPIEIPIVDNDKLAEIIKNILGIDVKFPCDGNSRGGNVEQLIEFRRGFLSFIKERIAYFPVLTPEKFLLDNLEPPYLDMFNSVTNKNTSEKNIIAEIAKLDTGQSDFVSSDDIFNTQIRILAKISPENEVFVYIKNILHSFYKNGIVNKP